MLSEAYHDELKGLVEKREEAKTVLQESEREITEFYKKIISKSYMNDVVYESFIKLVEHYEGGKWEIQQKYTDDDYCEQFLVNEDGRKYYLTSVEVDEYSVITGYIDGYFYRINYYLPDENLTKRLWRIYNNPNYIEDFMDLIIMYRLEHENTSDKEIEVICNYFIENYNVETRKFKNKLEIGNDYIRKLKK